MSLNIELNNHNVNIEDLQKGLKHIGLNLSRFDGVGEARFSELIQLFKIAVDIDPKTTSKFIKMDLRSKLEKILKGQTINNHSAIVASDVAENKVVESHQLKNNDYTNRQPQLTLMNKKLGKVRPTKAPVVERSTAPVKPVLKSQRKCL